MSTVTFRGDFFSIAAAQPGLPHIPEDALERAILTSQQKDAAILWGFLAKVVQMIGRQEDTGSDRIENAILACQRKDAEIVRNALSGH